MPHRAGPLLAAFAVIALFAVFVPGPLAGAQSQEAAVSLTGATRVAPDAEDVLVNVDVAGVSDLAGFQFTLSVDPKVLQPVSVDKTAFLATTGRDIVCRDAVVNQNSVSYACVTLRQEPAGVDGAGTIAVVTLKPVAKGDSALQLSGVKLVHPDGSEIASHTTDSRMTVGTDAGWFSWPMIALIAGAVVAVLVIAGFIVWWRRRSRHFVGAEPAGLDSDTAYVTPPPEQ